MTIDAAKPEGKLRLAAQAGAVLGLWFATLVLLTAAIEPLPTAAVFGPPARLLTALSRTDTRLVSAGPGFIVVRGETPGYVRDLYANGALLVLPAGREGCLGGLRRT